MGQQNSNTKSFAAVAWKMITMDVDVDIYPRGTGSARDTGSA